MKLIKIKKFSDAPLINLVIDTIKKNKQTLVFVNTKRSAEKSAEDITNSIKGNNNLIKEKNKELEKLSYEVLNTLSRPTKQCERLAKCIKKGVAFHHAGLISHQRELIEDNFRNGLIKVICSTFTLAYGIDLPAFRSIIKDVRRYSSRFGLQFIPTLEFLQMAGRAGRPKFDKYGEAIAIASNNNEKDKIKDRYINGKPEKIYSKLAVEPVLRTYLLSLIATGFINNKRQITDFFSKTFWAFQFKDIDYLESIINKILKNLYEWRFITIKKLDFVSANKIKKWDNEEEVKATLLGKRVTELYIDPLTAFQFICGLKKGVKMGISSFPLLQLISYTTELRPLLKVRIKETERIEESLVSYQESLLCNQPGLFEPEYDDFINSIKTAQFFEAWISEKDEESLLEDFNIRPGEIRVKLDNADWLLYCCEELARILRFLKLIKEIKKLRFRLKHGIKEELIPLVRLENIGRVRARKLFKNGIKDIEDLKKTNIISLMQILGENVALKVKEQLGQKVSIIKQGKRKGQISLEDY
jgi:helicase